MGWLHIAKVETTAEGGKKKKEKVLFLLFSFSFLL